MQKLPLASFPCSAGPTRLRGLSSDDCCPRVWKRSRRVRKNSPASKLRQNVKGYSTQKKRQKPAACQGIKAAAGTCLLALAQALGDAVGVQ